MSDLSQISTPKVQKRAKKVKKEISVLQREYEVIKLRTEGKTYQQIADQLGYADDTGARAAWLRAMERIPAESVNEYRQIQMNRLEATIAILWPKIEAGDLQAVPPFMAVLKEQSALLGLYAPKEAKLEVTTYEGRALRERAEEIIGILRAHRDTQGGVGREISQA